MLTLFFRAIFRETFRGCGLVAVFSTEKLIADRPQAFLFEGVSEDSMCVT
jgi:hypothetical protein